MPMTPSTARNLSSGVLRWGHVSSMRESFSGATKKEKLSVPVCPLISPHSRGLPWIIWTRRPGTTCHLPWTKDVPQSNTITPKTLEGSNSLSGWLETSLLAYGGVKLPLTWETSLTFLMPNWRQSSADAGEAARESMYMAKIHRKCCLTRLYHTVRGKWAWPLLGFAVFSLGDRRVDVDNYDHQ